MTNIYFNIISVFTQLDCLTNYPILTSQIQLARASGVSENDEYMDFFVHLIYFSFIVVENVWRNQVSNATDFRVFSSADIGQKKEDNRATFESQNLKKCHSYPRLKGIKSRRYTASNMGSQRFRSRPGYRSVPSAGSCPATAKTGGMKLLGRKR